MSSATADRQPVLLGRRNECDGLDRLLTSVRNGQSQVLVVRGEAGALLSALYDKLSGEPFERLGAVLELAGEWTRAAGVEQGGEQWAEAWSQLEGENGKDTIRTTIALDAGSTGTVRAWVLGMNGPDNLTLDVSGAGVDDLAALLARLDGGLGHDNVTASPGVNVLNVP